MLQTPKAIHTFYLDGLLASNRFWLLFAALPVEVQELARRNYALLRQNSSPPSLHYKPVKNGAYCSVRVGLHYRAFGLPVADGILWFWIGSHAEYDRLIA